LSIPDLCDPSGHRGFLLDKKEKNGYDRSIFIGNGVDCVDKKLYRPGVKEIFIQDAFWKPYLENIRKITLPYVFDRFGETGYIHNFEIVAAGEKEGFQGPPFSDGLLLETIRGACDFLAVYPDQALEERVEGIIGKVCAASDASPDGFLCTSTMLRFPEHRYGEGHSIVEQHDLYDQGALVEAAIAHYRATGRKNLLKTALRSAARILSDIGPAPKKNIVPGHSLPEEAFTKLSCLIREDGDVSLMADEYGVTADACLKLTQFWYDARGNWQDRTYDPRFSHEYNQDHLPFAKQTKAVGHAVRAALCYTGAAAVARETGRDDYLPALSALWENITQKKLHISGGIGTRHDIEGFDEDYNLPNDAYLETCAAIAFCFFAGEMSLLKPKGAYFDYFEQSLYNNVLASVGEDFTHYFYENPLVSKGNIARWPWHGCPCCPPMLAKIFSSLSTYIYTTGENELYVNLYIGSELHRENLTVIQEPGRIAVDSFGREITVLLRIPGYATGYSLNMSYREKDGYAVLKGIFAPEKPIEYHYEQPVRRVIANPDVRDDLGKVAVMCGPVLYCAEGIDNMGVTDRVIAEKPDFRVEKDSLTCKTEEGTLTLIPYWRWRNRHTGNQRDDTMQVWFTQKGIPEEQELRKRIGKKLYTDYEE